MCVLVLNNIKWNSTNSISLIFFSFHLAFLILLRYLFIQHIFFLLFCSSKNRFRFRKPHSIKTEILTEQRMEQRKKKKMYFKYPGFLFPFDNCALTNRFNEVCTRKPLTIHRRCFVKCFPNWIKNLTKNPAAYRWNCEFIIQNNKKSAEIATTTLNIQYYAEEWKFATTQTR